MATIWKQVIVTVVFTIGTFTYNLTTDEAPLLVWLVTWIAYGAAMAFVLRQSLPRR